MSLAILSSCRDEHTLPAVIPSNHGIGVTFKDDMGIEYTTIEDNGYRDKIRRLRGKITTWRGLSSDAKHYYCKIYSSDPLLKYINDGVERISSISGSFSRFKPIECRGFNIEFVRRITENEIDENSDRWGCRVGDMTTGFDTEEELIKLVKEVFKKRFKGQWVLELTYDYDRKTLKLKKNTKL